MLIQYKKEVFIKKLKIQKYLQKEVLTMFFFFLEKGLLNLKLCIKK